MISRTKKFKTFCTSHTRTHLQQRAANVLLDHIKYSRLSANQRNSIDREFNISKHEDKNVLQNTWRTRKAVFRLQSTRPLKYMYTAFSRSKNIPQDDVRLLIG